MDNVCEFVRISYMMLDKFVCKLSPLDLAINKWYFVDESK